MSWKKYGGINKLDKMNNMNVNNLTTDTFSLQNPYLGDLDICGNVYVSGSLRVDNQIDTADINTSGNVVVSGALIAAQMNVENLVVDSNSFLIGDLTVVGKLIFDTSGSSVMVSDTQQHLGLNNFNPVATLDVCGNAVSSLILFSTNDYTRNIIAQNISNRGISVETDSSSSSISFYNDSPVNGNADAYSARLEYTKSGIFNVDVGDTTNILSKMVVSSRTDLSNVLESAFVVYDISSGLYQYSVYKNPDATTGEAITMFAKDASSTTMMHIITPDQKGLVVAGGAYPNDTSRSMATFGWIDTRSTSGVEPALIPAQMIVSGNNRAKYMATVGINTYAPRTEQYVLDINGPIHIANGQLRVSQPTMFEVKQITRSLSFQKNVIAVGSPSSNAPAPYIQNIYYSGDEGQSWNLVRVGALTNIKDAPNVFNAVFAYDSSFSVIAGDGGYMFYTVNAGQSWYQLAITQNPSFVGVYIGAVSIYLINHSNLYYFTNPYPANALNPTDITITAITIVSLGVFNVSSPATCMCGNGTFLYIAGTRYISKYNESTYTLVSSYDAGANVVFYSVACYGSNVIAVGEDVVLGVYVIAVSMNNGVSWVKHEGLVAPSLLRSVFIYDGLRAIACGDNGLVLYTNDYANDNTWSLLPADLLRVSGNSGIVLDASNDFVGIHMADPNTVVLSATRSAYNNVGDVRTGESYLFYCFLPALFNNAMNRVLDLCGNMHVSGDIDVENDIGVGGNIRITGLEESVGASTGALVVSAGAGVGANLWVGGNVSIEPSGTLYVYNTNYGATYGQGAVVVSGGGSFGGNVNVMGNLNVAANVVVEGLVEFAGDTFIDKNSESISTNTGSLVVIGGIGLSANIFIGGNSTVYRDSRFYGNSVIYQTTESIDISSGAFVVYGGAGIGANLYVGGNTRLVNPMESTSMSSGSLVVSGGMGVNSNVYVGGNVRFVNPMESTSTNTGSLVVSGGVGVNSNVYVGGNVRFVNPMESTSMSSGSLVVSGGMGVNSNVYVGGNVRFVNPMESTSTSSGSLVVSGGMGVNSNVYVGGNVRFVNPMESTSTNTGSLVVSGGMGVNSNVYVGGNVRFVNPMESTSMSSGSLVVSGGMGVNSNVYVGGNVRFVNLMESVSTSSGSLVVSGGMGVNSNVYVGGNVRFVNPMESTSTNTGSLVVSGGMGVNSNVYVGGNVRFVNRMESVSTSSGSLVVSGGMGVNSNVYVGGNVRFVNPMESVSTSSGSLVVSGGMGVNSNVYFGGNVRFVNPMESVSTSSGSLVVSGGMGVNSNVYVGGNVRFVNPMESTNTNTGSLVVSGGMGVNSNVYVGGNVRFTNPMESTSTSSGSFVVSGGMGIGANVYVSGNIRSLNSIDSTSTSSGSFVVSGGMGIGANVYVSGNIRSLNSIDSTSTSTGSLVVSGGAGIGANLYVGGSVRFINTSASLGSSTTGALVVSGGVGVAGNVFVDNMVRINNVENNKKIVLSDSSVNEIPSAATLFYGFGKNSGVLRYQTDSSNAIHRFYSGAAEGVLVAGNLLLNNTNESTSNATGALRVAGGAGIGANLYVGGSVRFINTSESLGSSTTGALVVSGGVGVAGNIFVDNMVRINNNFNNKKIVLWDSSVNEIPSGATQFCGFGINASTLRYQTDVSNSIHRFYSGAAEGVLVAGNLLLNNTNESTSTATGALRVAGGAGIAGAINVGTTANIAGQTRITNGTASTTTTTGALIVTGGVGIGGAINVGSTANIAGATRLTVGTASTTTTTGALIVTGGVGISGAVFAGGTITAPAFNANSDYRIKSNIVSLTTTNFSVDKLNPVYYYNTVSKNNDVGFIAHEVQAEYPFLVSGEKDGDQTQSLNYLGLIGILVKDVKILKASNEELKASNEELKASNEELKASNEELKASNAALNLLCEDLKKQMAELREWVASR